MLRKISTWFEKEPENISLKNTIKRCDHGGCNNEGVYKAPKAANNVSNHHNHSDWYWFCKDHVRDYNANWNFYKNMTEEQAYRSFKNDRVWNRLTWPIHSDRFIPTQYQAFHDPFHIIPPQENKSSYLSLEQNNALTVLELRYPFTSDELQLAYRQKVKQFHPDINQCPENEERIRQINLAYQSLKSVSFNR
ncbi:MAG: DnaJ domain-containing protein [Proteobacteria bacterium]|nr:DnaJ domain-containing protein [Pseudomonadota bacterium]